MRRISNVSLSAIKRILFLLEVRRYKLYGTDARTLVSMGPSLARDLNDIATIGKDGENGIIVSHS